MIIEAVIIVGLVIDLILTYNYLRVYRQKFPNKDFAIIEANPLIRKMIRSYGLGDGVFYSGLIIMLILLVLLKLFSENGKFFMAGAYYMMITFHLTNLLALKRMKSERRSNKCQKTK